MKIVLAIAISATVLLATNIRAQLQFSSEDLSTIESGSPLDASQLPPIASFYSAAHPQNPPAPIDALGWPAWFIGTISGNDIYLLDDLDTLSGGGMRAMDDSGGPIPPGAGGGGGDEGGSGYFPEFSGGTPINTNLLWLQITNISGGTVFANLHNATNEVYAIWYTMNLALPFADWQVAQEIWPTNDTMPFTVETMNRQMLFLRAEDWTGVTANGNQTPQWFFFYYFGAAGLDLLDSDLDSQGNTLLTDYEYGMDPNIISFSVSTTNNYVSSMNVPFQLNVTAGTPSYFAVLVDTTNFTDFANATWHAYTSQNITVNFCIDQGWHTVCVGLRGLPPDAQPTWETIMLNFDTAAPLLVITNPVNNTVAAPYIELQGYADEQLSSITYAISNAFGIQTNLVGYVTGEEQAIDGAITNYFQCFDVALTNGLNLVTVTATDLAGNQTVTNLNFTLDYSSNTNPPVVAITWPQNGTQIGGTNFTLDGQVDDPTETVCASITDTNGDTNTVNGLVERNGKFWVERIPLNAGTNNLTLTATNAAGNVTVTNICVVQSAITLTMDPVTPSSQLWQPTVNLTGEISDPTYAVWVNGVKGTNNGNGTWSANNVPTTSGGTASFTMTGYAPTEQQPDGSYGN